MSTSGGITNPNGGDVLIDGAYVLLKMAPNTRKGTLHNSDRKGQWLFHQDPRFINPIEDIYVFEDEVILCPRPSDAEVSLINDLIKRGSQIDRIET